MTAFGATVLLEQQVVTHCGLVKYFRNTDLVYTATREVELAIWRRDHVANYAPARRNGGRGGERLRRRVKSYDSVCRRTGFDIPDHSVRSRGDAVGFTVRTAW